MEAPVHSNKGQVHNARTRARSKNQTTTSSKSCSKKARRPPPPPPRTSAPTGASSPPGCTGPSWERAPRRHWVLLHPGRSAPPGINGCFAPPRSSTDGNSGPRPAFPSGDFSWGSISCAGDGGWREHRTMGLESF